MSKGVNTSRRKLPQLVGWRLINKQRREEVGSDSVDTMSRARSAVEEPFKDVPHVKIMKMQPGKYAAVDIAKHESQKDMGSVAQYVEDRARGKKKSPVTVGASQFLARSYEYSSKRPGGSGKPLPIPGSVKVGLQGKGFQRTTEKKMSLLPIDSPQYVRASPPLWRHLVKCVDLPMVQLIADHMHQYAVYQHEGNSDRCKQIKDSLNHWLDLVDDAWRETHKELLDAPLDRDDDFYRWGIPRPLGVEMEELRILWNLGDESDGDSAAGSSSRAAAPGASGTTPSPSPSPAPAASRDQGSEGGAAYRERGFSGTLLGSGSPPAATVAGTATSTPVQQPVPATIAAPSAQAQDPASAGTTVDPGSAPPPAKRPRVSFTEDLGDEDEFADAVQNLFAGGAVQPADPALQQPAPRAAAGDGVPADPAQQPPAPPAPAQRNFLVRAVKGTVGAVGQALVNASR